jgi:DNA polymerase elongation subunit (family B)
MFPTVFYLILRGRSFCKERIPSFRTGRKSSLRIGYQQNHSYYETQLVQAVESVLSPLGWDRTDIRRELGEARELDLTAFIVVQNE